MPARPPPTTTADREVISSDSSTFPIYLARLCKMNASLTRDRHARGSVNFHHCNAQS
jgi:hypothetical protein